jgi:transcriptional regulator with PAS, ATPase and Fis domain
MPPLMQTKMLRVLQEKEIERIGGKKNITVDVRFIAATNRNLEQMVERGQFRADLFYRLNILTVGVPSLRERKVDIPLLAEHLLADLYRELGIVKKLDEEAVRILEKYTWPGNVRELKNVLEKMLINSVDATITTEEIPLNIMQKVQGGRPTMAVEGLDQEIGKFEKELIRRVLKSTNRNIKRSAELLRIPRPRLYRLIKRYNITQS